MDKMVMNGRGCSTRCWLPRPGGGFLPCHGLPISPHSSVEESAAGLSLLLAFHPSLGDSLLGHLPHKLAPRQGGVLQLKQQDGTPPFGSNPRKGGAPAPPQLLFPLGGEVGLGRKGEWGRARALPFQMQPETKGN